MLNYFTSEMVSATLRTFAAGSTDSDGEWVAGADTDTSIKIIVPQPLNANDLKVLEGGEHVSNYLKTWVSVPVTTRESTKDADRIIYNSKTYEVFQYTNRDVLGSFRKLIIREITDD